MKLQSTSATWRALWAAGARLEARVTVDGVERATMTSPVISRALTQDGPGVGNAVSAMCQATVLTSDAIAKAATVRVHARLTDGATTSEWLPAGTFFIARRRRDPVNGTLALECYDALLKANAIWEPASGGWPRAMSAVADELAALLGVTMDARTQLESGSIYAIDEPQGGETIRDMLCRIAAANGGNWIVTPENKLRLVPLVSAAGAASASSDVADVAAITGGIEAGVAGKVTGVRYQSSGGPVVLGDETGLVIDADVGAAIASDLYDKLAGNTYQPYSLEGAVYDPAAELGDYVRAGANGEIASLLCAETAVLSAMFHGMLTAPQPDELSDEYPYIGGASEKALAAAKVYAAEAVASLDAELDQAGVFDRLTDGGTAQGIYMVDGELYVNMSYARSGTLVLGGANNQNGLLQVQDASGNVVGSWDKDGVSIVRGALSLPVDSSQNNTIMINGVDDVASYRRAFLIRYKQGSNNPIRTMLDRGEISIKTTSNSGSVSYGAVSIKPGKVLLSSDNAFSTVLVSLNGTTTYYDDGYMTSGTAKLYLYNGRIYLTYRNAETGSDVMWFDLNVFRQTMTLLGSATFGSVSAGNGASGTFTSADGKTVTVTDGIVTGIV